MLRIAIAHSPEEIDEILQLRHHALTEGKDPVIASNPVRFMDRFDAFPSTSHIVAILNHRIIASLRITFDSNAKTPADEHYDFRAHLPAHSKVMSCDLHCTSPDFHIPEITSGLMLVASYLAISEQITHIISMVDTGNIETLKQIGFHILPQADHSSQRIQKTLPMALDIAEDLQDAFVRFSQRNELQDIIHSYGCALYEPGEPILRAGAVGNCAFVIAEGEVEVKHPGGDEVIDRMGVGEVFGEMALLTDQVRSADIIASTRVRTMVLEKSVFVEHLMSEPKVALNMLQSMGHRMKHLIDYCHTITAENN